MTVVELLPAIMQGAHVSDSESGLRGGESS